MQIKLIQIPFHNELTVAVIHDVGPQLVVLADSAARVGAVREGEAHITRERHNSII